jgi:hypothetical protein
MTLTNNGNNLQIQMKVADLRSLAPKADAGGATLIWHTQWKVPSTTDLPNGGKYFHAYMQSIGGGMPTFAAGENATEPQGGGLMATYPGSIPVTGSYTATAPGVITINVPTNQVVEPGAINNILYSVTSSSMTLPPGFPTADGPNLNGIGGVPFNLVDVAPAYDFNPSLSTPVFNSCRGSDGSGSIQGQRGGSATFQSDEDACEDGDQAREQFTDPGAGENFYSTQIESVVFDDMQGAVTITGSGIANGLPVSFVIVEQVASALTPAIYTIVVSDGYQESGTLIAGTFTR